MCRFKFLFSLLVVLLLQCWSAASEEHAPDEAPIIKRKVGWCENGSQTSTTGEVSLLFILLHAYFSFCRIQPNQFSSRFASAQILLYEILYISAFNKQSLQGLLKNNICFLINYSFQISNFAPLNFYSILLLCTPNSAFAVPT